MSSDFQVKIFNEAVRDESTPTTSTDFEKADLESCEKERSETKLSLPIPSASTSMSNSACLRNSQGSSPTKCCVYRDECENFKKKLLLPGIFRYH